MKRLPVVLLVVLSLAGCVAQLTPYGVSIEPMDLYLVGPPVIVASPPGVVVQPLPPVAVVPDRRVYYYGDVYYYFWGDAWYWGRQSRGPWHPLPRDRWPARAEPSGKGHHGGGKGKH